MTTEKRDMNRDPITDAPGSHPVGVGVGGVGGAAVGAGIGAIFGPIGMLVGGAVGTLAGASAGKGVAESIDPTGEAEYWQDNYRDRPYADERYDFNDYGPAYAYGNRVHSENSGKRWDDNLDNEVKAGWEDAKAKSRLTWDEAKGAARDAFDRSDRTHRTYEATDRFHRDNHSKAEFNNEKYDYEGDYQPAYRYGTHARSANPDRDWDDNLESELGRDWEKRRGNSSMSWDDAKHATKEAWHKVERALPGDADGDGR